MVCDSGDRKLEDIQKDGRAGLEGDNSVLQLVHLIQENMENDQATVFAAIELVFLIAALVLKIIGDNKLSKSFGHGAGFTVGLVFLNPIFKLILGFGSSKYVGNTTDVTNKQA